MLSDAFTAMALSVRNHASEFLPGGDFCSEKITPELRKRLEGMPLTSVAAETMFARVKRRADRGGRARHDTHMGGVLCERDDTVGWAHGKADAEGLMGLGRKRLREGSGSRTMADEWALKGEATAPVREAKLAKKQSGRAAKAAELERLKDIELKATYSALKAMGNEELSDQLKVYKRIQKKSGFTVIGTGPEMCAKLQSLIFDNFGASTNDLDDGDSGLEGRPANDGKRRVRKVAAGGGSSKGKGKGKGRGKKKANIVSLHGWEWESDEEFEIERLVGKMVADGVTEVPGRTGVAAGTVLCKVMWAGFPPEHATWKEENDIPCGEVDFLGQYEEGLKAEEAEEAEVDDDDE